MSNKLFDNLRIAGETFPRLRSDPRKLAQYVTMIRTKCPHWTDRDHRMALEEMKFADRWVTSGQIVYNLSHSLAALFAMTSAPPLDWKHAPHDAFVVKIPRRFLPVDGTIEPEYTYIYIAQHGTLLVADWDTTAVLFVEYGDSTSQAALETVDRRKLSRGAEDALREFNERSEEMFDVHLREVRKHLPQVEDQLARDLARAAMQLRRDEFAKMASEATTLDARSLGLKVLVSRFVSNVIAYVTEHRASPGSVPKCPGLPLHMTLLPPVDVFVDRSFRDAAGAAVDAIMEGSMVGIRRVLAHYVRGHWRNQPVGSGRSDRKLIWIAPHRRGSESFGAVVRRVEHLDIPVRSN